jgi:truncated hemoglobin YjbI
MEKENTLFERIGGQANLDRIADRFVSSMQEDSLLERYFEEYDDENVEQIVDRVAECLSALANGPSNYQVATAVSVLSRLGINERDWATAMGYLVTTDRGAGLSKQAHSELVQLVSKLGPQVIVSRNPDRKAAF